MRVNQKAVKQTDRLETFELYHLKTELNGRLFAIKFFSDTVNEAGKAHTVSIEDALMQAYCRGVKDGSMGLGLKVGKPTTVPKGRVIFAPITIHNQPDEYIESLIGKTVYMNGDLFKVKYHRKYKTVHNQNGLSLSPDGEVYYTVDARSRIVR